MQEQVADWLDGRLASDPTWAGSEPDDSIDVGDVVVTADDVADTVIEHSSGSTDVPSWLDDASLVGVEIVDGADAIVVSEHEVADALAALSDGPDAALADDLSLRDDLPGDGNTSSMVDPFDVMLASSSEQHDDARLDADGGVTLGDTPDDVAPVAAVAPASVEVDHQAPESDIGDAAGPPVDIWSPTTPVETSGLDAFDEIGVAVDDEVTGQPDGLEPGPDGDPDVGSPADDGFDGGFA